MVDETVGSAVITATLSHAVSGGFDVTVSTTDGTAIDADGDYTTTTTTLSFVGTVNEMQTFMVSITDDAVVEGDETFTVSLSGLSVPAAMVDITSAASLGTVTITDDDSAGVAFVDPSPSVVEGSGMRRLTVMLDNNVVQEGFDVTVSTMDGSGSNAAVAGSDYTGIPRQTLRFVGTANEIRTFTVPITDDRAVEAPETFTVMLSDLTGITPSVNITAAAPSSTVTITDDDSAVVTFRNSSVTVNEAAGTIELTADAGQCGPGWLRGHGLDHGRHGGRRERRLHRDLDPHDADVRRGCR